MNSSKSTKGASKTDEKERATTVEEKNQSAVRKSDSVSSRRTKRTDELNVDKALVQREVGKNVSSKHDYTLRVLRKSPSGVIECNFKTKSSGEVKVIEVMPLGYKGYETDWNPDGLNVKELLKERYSEGSQNSFGEVFGYFYTPYAPLSIEGTKLPKKIFTVYKGFDIAVGVAMPNQDKKDSISRSAFTPYLKLARKMDAISERMMKNDKGVKAVYAEAKAEASDCIDDRDLIRSYAYAYALISTRARIGGDILRVERGSLIKGRYTAEEWHHLAEFAMIIRADKARAPKCTRYNIDKQVSDTFNSFVERFGSGSESLYMGAPKGGAKKLKEDQENYAHRRNAELTDPGTDKPSK